MNERLTPEEVAQEVRRLVGQLQAEGRNDLLLRALGVPLLEELRIEAAKGKLSRLLITKSVNARVIWRRQWHPTPSPSFLGSCPR